MTIRRAVMSVCGCARYSAGLGRCAAQGCWLVLMAGATAWAVDPFAEEAIQRGINYQTPRNAVTPAPYGRGMAFADLDGDGDADLIATGAADGHVGVFENTGGSFTSRSATSGIPIMMEASGVVALDYDGDGDLDLFITQWGASNKLLRNDGGFAFSDVTAIAGLEYTGPATGPTTADFDGDGRLDLFVPMYGEENRLYRNVDGATFTEVAASVGIMDAYYSFQAAFFDMDNDGDKDIYVSNDRRTIYNTIEHNRLFENVGGTFVDVSAGSGADVSMMSMNVALGDLDNNGLTDIYCTNLTIEQLGLYYPNVLLMNGGAGQFTEQQQAAGVESYRFSWGAAFLDFNNDGRLDLYVCSQFGANRLYVHKGTWPLVDEAGLYAVGLEADSRCVAMADVDDDGDTDMLVQSYDDRLKLFINQAGGAGNHIRIRPVGPLPNRQSIGSVIRLRVGTTWQMHELVAGSNYKVQNELVAHFGLDAASGADEVTIAWPDGASRSLGSLPASGTYIVYHPSLLGDGNGDGTVDVGDVAPFVNDVLGRESTDDGLFDFTGDGVANGADLQGLVARILSAP